MPRLRWFLASATVVLLASLSPAQQSPAPPAGGDRPVLRTTAKLVLVDVVVTKDGKPVQGLTAQQFQIFDNGKVQRIATFDEHRSDDTTEARPMPPLPSHTWSDAPQLAVTSAANVLLLDALNTPIADQGYARRQMLEYLKQIPPGTRMAVFTLASRLRMITGFTTDAGAIEAAITHGKGGVQQSPVLESPQDEDTMDDVAASMSGVDGGAMQQFVADLTSFRTDLRVQMTLDAMEQLARYLSEIPGRKNLIWFSGSFPLQIQPDPTLDPAATAQGGASPRNMFSAVRDYSDQLKATDGLLAAARVAVYPVDARGLMTFASMNASRSFSGGQGLPSYGGGRGTRGGGWAPPQQSGASAANQADAKFLQTTVNEHQAMQQIAEETGGEPFFDTNGLKEAVAQAIGNGSNYFTVGYVPETATLDGSFHRIEVKVDGGSYDLAYRRGYYAVDPLKPSAEAPSAVSSIVAALERGAPPLSQIVFEARVLAASDPAAKMVKVAAGPAGELASHLKGPATRYLVDFSIDAHGMEWTALEGGEAHGELEVSMVAWNGEGERVNYTDKGIAFSLNPAQAAEVAKIGLPIHQEIDLPSGKVYLRIAVHDLRSGKIGSMEVPLEVGKK